MVKQTSTKIGSILSTLFQLIQHDLRADNPARTDKLIEQYLKDPRNHVPQNQEARTSARGNLRKDIAADAISLKTFVRLMAYLRVFRFRIIIEIPHANGKVTQHSVEVDVNGGTDILEDDS